MDNITESPGPTVTKKGAELLLAEAETQLRTVLKTIPDMIWLKNQEGVYLSCNPMFERFFGAKEIDIVGKTDYDFVDNELANFFREKDSIAMSTGKPSINEEMVTFADDGHRAQLETIKTPMYDCYGNLVGVIGIARDITERKRIEEALKNKAMIQTLLMEIAEATSLASSMDELYAILHRLINRVLPAKNFYISLLDDASSQLVIQYCVDVTHTVPLQRPAGKGMTDYVMRQRRAVCVTPPELARLRESGEVLLSFVCYTNWAGAPLINSIGKVFGVIALFSIDEEDRSLLPEDLEVLSIIAAHVSLIIERKQAEKALVESEERYRAVMEQSPEAVITCDPDTDEILEANTRFTEQFGYNLSRDGKLNMFDLIVDGKMNISAILEEIKSVGFLPAQRRMLRHKNGMILDVEQSATLIHFGGRALVVQTLRDVSEKVKREQEERFHSSHDELTGLYNRRGFVEAMAVKLSSEDSGALLLVGIDDFKLFNDVHGYENGNKYLVALSTYLRDNFGEASLIARFGGDEFILFFPGSTGLHEATRSSEIMEIINLKTEMGYSFVQVSGGISLFPEHGNNLDMLVQRAYMALHHTKKCGKKGYKIYEPILQDNVSRRYEIKAELYKAMTNDEFHLVFQPIFDIRKSVEKIVGYEALLRWTNPKLGVVSPAEFIPVAEESNLIIPIGQWVLREACLFSVNIWKLYGEFVHVSVNISMNQLAMHSFVGMVKETLRETGLPACNLGLEVTESILMTDVTARVKCLQELRDWGIDISLDDFGTGYSSFTYLSQIPITTLKIDKSMVDKIIVGGNQKSLLLLEALLKMSALLGYKAVAEGVETEEQLLFLRSKGCGYCQGYLLSWPLPESAVLAMCEKRQVATGS